MKNTAVLSILIAFVITQIIAVPLPFEDTYDTQASDENTLGLVPKASENEQEGEDIQSKIKPPSNPVVVRQVSTPVLTHLPPQPMYTPLNPGVVNHHVHNDILSDALYKRQLQQHFSQNQAKFKQVGTSLHQLHGMVKAVDKKTNTVIKETKTGFTATHSKINKNVNKAQEDLIKVIESLNELRSTVEANEVTRGNELHQANEEIKRVEQATNVQIADAVNTIRDLQQIVTNPLLPGTGPGAPMSDSNGADDPDLNVPT